MLKARRLLAIWVIACGAAIVLVEPARAMDLTGVWTSQGDLCKMAFTKKGNEVVFAELSDLYGSGFIIDGNRIKAKAVECTINSKKQSGDMIELNARKARDMNSLQRENRIEEPTRLKQDVLERLELPSTVPPPPASSTEKPHKP